LAHKIVALMPSGPPIWIELLNTARDSELEYLIGFNLFKQMAICTFQTYPGICAPLSDSDRVIDPLS
jgi:hypothetical protein